MRLDIQNNVADTNRQECRERVIDKAKPVAFLKSANRKVYGKLLASIKEQHSFKINMYPKTLSNTYETTIQTNHLTSKQQWYCQGSSRDTIANKINPYF